MVGTRDTLYSSLDAWLRANQPAEIADLTAQKSPELALLYAIADAGGGGGGGGGTDAATIAAGVDLSSDIEAIKASLAAIASSSTGFVPAIGGSGEVGGAGSGSYTMVTAPPGFNIHVHVMSGHNLADTEQHIIVKRGTSEVTAVTLFSHLLTNKSSGFIYCFASPLIIPTGETVFYDLSAATLISHAVIHELVAV